VGPSRNAIKAFQKKNMLKITGKLDKETLAKLK
jgi:ABC-type transporter Mla MlaB component